MSSSDRTLLAGWLRAIPQSRHSPRPLHEMPGGADIGRGLAALLEVWGAVELSEDGIRAVSQSSYYFLHSLAAWCEMPGTAILDWSEHSGANNRKGMQHGVSLVHVLESERLTRDPGAKPIRVTDVAQILIVRSGDPAQFLGQWDDRAGFYQLIGGRQKRDKDWVEPIFETAVREVEEELYGQIRYEAGDFKLERLADFDGETRLSPSYGALTAYHFTFYRATGLPPLELSAEDRWLSRKDLLTGSNNHGEPIRSDHLKRLEKMLAHIIDDLPSSFQIL
ncbi:MAG: NUDIX hydrolase [Chloroflexi bacterium]|nr:NUDIX hydrolase [Chloroflexota bacterium]